jgi:hypothetical protein
MTEEQRPDPLAALRAAAQECGVSLPEGLLEAVLQLETEATEQHLDRGIVQASLRAHIENHAREGS